MALFTNILLDLALKSVAKKWHFISRFCNISKKKFLEALKLVLKLTPNHLIKDFLNLFNSLHPKLLQFTLEYGGERLNFLDITIINANSKLEFNIFHKPTFPGRYLSFLSLYPLSQKRAVIMNCVDRVFLLSHPKYSLINLRLKSLFKRKTLKQSEKSNHMINDKEKISWFTIPFLPVIKKILTSFN
ncbi:hypothetical protein ALC60_12561 [Trachymyrmex zeteki]|uniref:Uncharacterized protein n=1 Tax=Mycetomoellerius zeteki TaxID=64791 RepID=A0A151WKJ1_9HYME|nr:hypothetical protein ALC60_12561 [Trachymyrmex zeteki]